VARRLAITRQRLSGALPTSPTSNDIAKLVADLGCLQLDPISVVARSHRLVLWSRLGPFDPTDLASLQWEERRLFEYWAHAASIVPTEDYPIHHATMRRYGKGDSPWARKVRSWLEANASLRRHVLTRLRRDGPLRARDIEDISAVGWRSGGWTTGRNVDRMLTFLWAAGKIAVARRSGQQRWWDMAERWLPSWTPRERLSDRVVVRAAAQRSLRALGVATPAHVEAHFIRGRYPGLQAVLARLRSEGAIVPMQVVDDGQTWPGEWYIHAEDLPLVDRLETGWWTPRTTLLSPFDNLICDRSRTELLFGFRYRVEIYVPKAKRKFGYYVLPILHGDRLIGRVDPVLDRDRGRLIVNRVHAEPEAPSDRGAARAVGQAITDLASYLGADRIDYAGPVPRAWSGVLRGAGS
jgi:uncharacterized protein YcaQ